MPEGQFYEKNSEGLYEAKREFVEEMAQPNNIFAQKHGLKTYYNMLLYPVTTMKTVDDKTEEVKMAQAVWKEGVVPGNVYFDMAGTGPEYDAKWGTFWGELPKWESKAILSAKSEDECKKVAQEMFKAFETNGGRAVADEKLKLYKDLLEKLK